MQTESFLINCCKRIVIFSLLCGSVLSVLAGVGSRSVVFADTADVWSAEPIDLQNSKFYGKVSAYTEGIPFLNKLIMFSAVITALALLIVIIINGIKVINNDKGPEALKEATKNISLSIAGMILASSSFIVIQSIGKIVYGDASFFTSPSNTLCLSGATTSAECNNGVTTGILGVLLGRWSFVDAILNGSGRSAFLPDSPNEVFGSFVPVNTSGGGLTSMTEYTYSTGPTTLFSSVVSLLVLIASVWLLVAIIWNGYKIITSQSPDVLAKAIRNVGVSIIGFLIAVMAYAITSYVFYRLFDSSVDLKKPTDQLIDSSDGGSGWFGLW
ncbi:hypothetical protein IJJ08_01940 [bacterium]|nr:hypothetical protein [bacterium]